MPAAAIVFVSKRLQPPLAALLCIAAMQLFMLVTASCHEEPLPMGAVRAVLNR